MPLKTISLIAFSSLAFASAASAAPASQVNFTYAASELTSTAGAQDVYARMERRAQSACVATASGRSLRETKAVNQCESVLLGEWVDAIGDARIHDIHASNGARHFASVK